MSARKEKEGKGRKRKAEGAGGGGTDCSIVVAAIAPVASAEKTVTSHRQRGKTMAAILRLGGAWAAMKLATIHRMPPGARQKPDQPFGCTAAYINRATVCPGPQSRCLALSGCFLPRDVRGSGIDAACMRSGVVSLHVLSLHVLPSNVVLKCVVLGLSAPVA